VLGGVLRGERLRKPLARIDLALRPRERSWSIASRVVIVARYAFGDSGSTSAAW
jgi:hypothetical protein